MPDLLSASWRPREVGDIIPSESEGLRTGVANDIKPNLRGREDEMRSLSSVR